MVGLDPGPRRRRSPRPSVDLPTLGFATRDAWRRWLHAHHATSAGIWMQISKKSAGVSSVTYDEAVEVALCYGWIDGQKAALDGAAWRQKFTPRRARSRWSQVNRSKAEDLMARGLMMPAGRVEVEAAQQDGRWEDAYAPQSAAGVPDDLLRALGASPTAAAAFAGLDSRNRYSILYRVQDAKRPETRARRIAGFVEMLAEGRKIYE